MVTNITNTTARRNRAKDLELRAVKIYTRKGDDGSTGLLFGGRVDKDNLRTQIVGTLDEAVAALGLARSLGPQGEGLQNLILEWQRSLFVAGAEVATSEENRPKLQPDVSMVTPNAVEQVERTIDSLTSVAPLPDYFIVPGGSSVSAALDLARAVIRRAERLTVSLARNGDLEGSSLLKFLNRLSDLIFVAARYEEKAAGVSAPPSRT